MSRRAIRRWHLKHTVASAEERGNIHKNPLHRWQPKLFSIMQLAQTAHAFCIRYSKVQYSTVRVEGKQGSRDG